MLRKRPQKLLPSTTDLINSIHGSRIAPHLFYNFSFLYDTFQRAGYATHNINVTMSITEENVVAWEMKRRKTLLGGPP
jgi:hypothetical protein